jgi:hypothetical protein
LGVGSCVACELWETGRLKKQNYCIGQTTAPQSRPHQLTK